jgi:transposase
MRRYELSDSDGASLHPTCRTKFGAWRASMTANVLNGILWRFRTGSPWADVLHKPTVGIVLSVRDTGVFARTPKVATPCAPIPHGRGSRFWRGPLRI